MQVMRVAAMLQLLLLLAVLSGVADARSRLDSRNLRIADPGKSPRGANYTVESTRLLMIIGIMKGGSTFLYATLHEHPHVIGARRLSDDITDVPHATTKELHYFNSIGRLRQSPIQWYWNHFQPTVCSNCIQIDATPVYMPSLIAPLAIEERIPDAHNLLFIALLRDPVDRAYSHYRHAQRRVELLRKRTERRSYHSDYRWAVDMVELSFEERVRLHVQQFDDCVEGFEASYKPSGDELLDRARLWETCAAIREQRDARSSILVTFGLYDLQLAYWMTRFPEKKFCLVHTSYLQKSFDKAMRVVRRFAGLVPFQFPDKTRPSSTHSQVADSKAAEILRDFYDRYTVPGGLFELAMRQGYALCAPRAETSADSQSFRI
eukprot:m.305037 g.305037  ORF g.305037 m.305037 type:complete len:377 (-) comp17460_c0_seq1:148-1278(-)